MRYGGLIRSTPLGRARGRGFSLVEILVAFTLLTLFVATSFQAFSAGIRSAALTGDHARAHILARSKLESLAASPTLEPGEDNGQVTIEATRTFRWRTILADYVLPDEAEGRPESRARPLLAVVEVTWESGVATPLRYELRALLLAHPQ